MLSHPRAVIQGIRDLNERRDILMSHLPGCHSEELLTVVIDTALLREQAERVRGLSPRIVFTEQGCVRPSDDAHCNGAAGLELPPK